MILEVKNTKNSIPNALKAFLVVEVPTNKLSKDRALRSLAQIDSYIKRELNIYDNDDDSLAILIFNSDRVNVQLLNSPYDIWEKYEDTLSEKFTNIEEFIKNTYYGQN